MQNYKITCTEMLKKIGLKLGLEKIEKNKVFLAFTVFFFKLLQKCNWAIFYKSHKNCYFSEKKFTKIVQWRQGDFALSPRTHFFQGLELASTVGYLISFQKYKSRISILQYFWIIIS